MFEGLKEMISVSDDELIAFVAMEESANAKRKASKAKREAMAEIFKTKDAEYLGVTVKKKDGGKKSFFV